jgi:hypothetical protein
MTMIKRNRKAKPYDKCQNSIQWQPEPLSSHLKMINNVVAQWYQSAQIPNRQDNAGPNVECYMEPIASKASMASRSAVGAPVPKTPVDAGKVPVLPRDAV